MPERLAGAAQPRVVPRLVRRYRHISAVSAVLVTVGGLLVLAGWAFEIDPLKRLLPGLMAMNPLTAVSFLVIGTALTARQFWTPQAPRLTIAVRAVGAAVAALGIGRVAGYAAGTDFGLDQLLFPVAVAAETPPSRIAPNTAYAFLFTGLALLALDHPRRLVAASAQPLALLVLLQALVTLTGYAYRVPDLTQISSFIPMALNTALAFVATSLSMAFATPERGVARSLVLDTDGGRIARRLLPAAVILPLALGWAGIQGREAGLFDTQTAISTMVAVGTLLLCVLILGSAESLTRAETLRAEVEQREARLQRALRQRARQLEAANTELEAFSYSVSHDLRAPLRSITGFSQALLEDHAEHLDGEARDYLDRVARAGQRMAGLIDDLLRLSRVARADMHRTDVDVSALAAEIVAQLQASDPGRKVEVQIADGMRLHADRQLLRVALDNLLENAWKYTSRNGHARIEVGDGGRTPEGTPVFFVRDNGAGFDMAQSHKLFSPFQRLHADAEFQGSGIGLATVQRVMRRHGGRAWAEGAVGEGATFYFTIDSTPEGSSA